MAEDVQVPIALIAAVAENGVIGREGGLPWRLPDDLSFFKRQTQGHAVIMGRRTFESLGGALPGRRNIVVTRRGGELGDVETASSLDDAVAMARQTADAGGEIFVAGGEQLYREALPWAQRLYLTRVHAEPAGETHFPTFDPSEWRLVAQEHHPADADHEYAFTFLTYHRE